MMKKWFGLLLAALLCLLCANALAAATQVCVWIGEDAFDLAEGFYLTNSGALKAGPPAAYDEGYVSYADGKLTLNRFKGSKIDMVDGNLIIELVGSSELSDSGDTLDADDCNVFIQGEGSLKLTSTGADGIDLTDCDLTVRGGSITIVSDDHGIEIDRTDADAGIGQFFMTGGMLNINAGDEGIDAEEGVTIDGGSITIEAVDQGIDSSESMTINGGVINIFALEDDGIEVSDYLYLNGGSLNVLTLQAQEEDSSAITVQDGIFAPYLPDEYQITKDSYDWYVIANAEGEILAHFCHDFVLPHAPQTGDSTPLSALFLLLCVSLLGVFSLGMKRKQID